MGCSVSMGSGRCPGGGHGNPLQDSCLENPMDRGAWRAAVRGVTKSRTRLKQVSNKRNSMHVLEPSRMDKYRTASAWSPFWGRVSH